MNPEDFLNEKSVLTAFELVSWKKNQRKYNFDTLPETALLSLSANLLERKTRFFAKKTKGLSGTNFILNKLVFCSDFGNGAAATINLMEELRALGVIHFIFVGFAGWIGKREIETGVFWASGGFSSVGVSRFYARSDYFEPRKTHWLEHLQQHLDLPETTCWSTDAPYRETPSMLADFVEKGANHVDMEVAAIYSFAQFYNLNALCLLVTADDLSSLSWQAPPDAKTLHRELCEIVDKLIKIHNG